MVGLLFSVVVEYRDIPYSHVQKIKGSGQINFKSKSIGQSQGSGGVLLLLIHRLGTCIATNFATGCSPILLGSYVVGGMLQFRTSSLLFY